MQVFHVLKPNYVCFTLEQFVTLMKVCVWTDIIVLQESYEWALVDCIKAVCLFENIIKYSKWHFWPWWSCYRQHLDLFSGLSIYEVIFLFKSVILYCEVRYPRIKYFLEKSDNSCHFHECMMLSCTTTGLYLLSLSDWFLPAWH